MKKISDLQTPAIAGVIREKTPNSAIAEITNAFYDGADMIDLHMSCLENSDTETLKNIISASKLPVLALNYNLNYDWTPSNLSEEDRIESFLRAVDAGAAGVDIQGYTFCPEAKHGFCGDDIYSFTKGNPKEIVTDEETIAKQCQFIEAVHQKGAEVLLSCHPAIPMNCTQVVELALFLEKRNPDIIKIVTPATSDEELAEAFKTMIALKKEVKTPVSYHANGEKGSLSRIVNPMLGGHIIFCVDRFSESSTQGQLDLRTTRTIVDNMRKIR